MPIDFGECALSVLFGSIVGRRGLTQVLGLMTDKFAALENRSRSDILVGGLSVLVLVVLFFVLFRWPVGAPQPVTGTVESSGAVSVARVAGSTREAASIRLDDGRLVIAQVGTGGPLSPGDKVNLLEQSRVLGGPAFQVVAKATEQ